MSFDIISILFVSLCYNGKSWGLMNNSKEWMTIINNNSNKTYVQKNQNEQIHELMNIYRTIKCYNNEKIDEFSNILADDKSDLINDDMNLLFTSKNTISILNNLTRKKRQLNKNYEILRELNRNEMEAQEKKITEKRDTNRKTENTSENKSQGANEGAAKDKVRREVKTTDEKVEEHVDAPSKEADAKKDNEKNEMEKKQSRATAENQDVNTFINKLDKILASSGDYIIALMLNNYKYRMRANHMHEKFLSKVQEMANKSGDNVDKIKNNLQKEIETKFGDEFIDEVANSLKTLAHDINLPS
ncbi:hypothetical protein PV327_001383 [Microctonus hyperodae]|uniref:Uncharacterized protein n=1 Tax=Microctonus hyperodae TaxID=165561 RepID=A0AA39G839_MICHY|nr:hypothetical protein PV327_001383 [Microctonus hyperodae]